MENKPLVQKQFGDKANAYATSKVHAKGASLGRMVEMVKPRHHWRTLDIATAAGHTAHAFAPHVSSVIATDLTPQMPPKAESLAIEKGLNNVNGTAADGEFLPFKPNSFDLVTCRIAPHHFPDINQFVSEAARVLRRDGLFVVVDNVVPYKRTRKKKEQRAYTNAADYINAFEKLRDPSHNRCLTPHHWETIFQNNGFKITGREFLRKEMAFNSWASRMNVSPDDTTRLKAMLVQAPQIVKDFLTPEIQGDTIKFYLTELILIGKLEAE